MTIPKSEGNDNLSEQYNQLKASTKLPNHVKHNVLTKARVNDVNDLKFKASGLMPWWSLACSICVAILVWQIIEVGNQHPETSIVATPVSEADEYIVVTVIEQNMETRLAHEILIDKHMHAQLKKQINNKMDVFTQQYIQSGHVIHYEQVARIQRNSQNTLLAFCPQSGLTKITSKTVNAPHIEFNVSAVSNNQMVKLIINHHGQVVDIKTTNQTSC